MKAVRKNDSKKRNVAASATANSNTARTPLVPSSPPTTVELRGVSIHFPFKPYKCQEDYMSKVLDALHHSENALLESPTGTGKTLCLLCAALAWQREQARTVHPASSQSQQQQQQLDGSSATTNTAQQQGRKGKQVPVIIYASRTHSQLSQVVRELKNTRYRPKHALLGSREQMCVNPKVKTATSTVTDINHECNRLGKDRKCRFRNQLEGFTPDSNEAGGSGAGIQPVMDMEDLLQMGKTRKVCPFYYTRSLIENAELLLVPYNYLFDKDARDTTLQDVPWSNAVVIFDEAHNLESFASESASFDLSSVDVGGCIQEVQRVVGYQQAMPELIDRISPDNLVRLKSIFLELEEYMLSKITLKESSGNGNSNNNVFAGDYMMHIFKEGARITHENHAMFVNEAKKVSDIIMDMRSGGSGSTNKGQTKIDFFIGCVKRVFGETTEGRCFAKARAYRVHVSSPKATAGNAAATAGRTVSYWCFAPSLAMQELANLNIRSVIVTSGTLSPLPSYSMELGIPFPHTLENPHIITDEQIHVRVIGHGVSGKHLSSSYNRRQDPEYIKELGSTVVNLARVVPDGMLIFFPSYGVMEHCIEQWGGPASGRKAFNKNGGGNNAFFASKRKQTSRGSSKYSFPHAPNFYGSSTEQTVWQRLLCQKAIILEPRSTAELQDAISDFHKYLNLPKSSGCILMGVCRGKISEGIDFAHQMCRAVVITGLPFAPYMDPKVKLKREYLEGIRAGQKVRATGEGGFGGSGVVGQAPVTLSGMEWYTQQAHRAVNQAVGRVIRNKYDYGAVLLLDSRFGEPNNKNGLSKWVRTRVLPDDKFGIAVSGLAKFYREAKAKALELEAERMAERPPIATVASSGILLAYEEEPESHLLSTSRIAVVKHSQDSSRSRSDGSIADHVDNGYIPQDQLVATLNLNSLQTSTDKSESRPTAQNPATTKTTGLASLYTSKEPPSAAVCAEPKSDSVWKEVRKIDVPKPTASSIHLNDKQGAASSKKIISQTSAQIFFGAAKAALDKPDFSSLRKLLVAMKKRGDSNDVPEYLKAAGSLVDILIMYDNLESKNFEWENSLSYLFFPLLPQARQRDVQKLVLRKQLKRTEFVKQCQEHLPEKDHRDFYTSIFSALKHIYCIPPEQPFSRTACLQSCLPVVRYLYIQGLHKQSGDADATSQNGSVLDGFYVLLPSRLRTSTRALLNEIRASQSTRHVKAKEKGREGEHGVDLVRFSMPKKALPPVEQEPKPKENPQDLENQRSMQASLMAAEQANSAKRNRVKEQLEAGGQKKKKSNPYPESSHTSSQRAASKAPDEKPLKPAVASSVTTFRNADVKSNGAKSPPRDRVSKLLAQAESSPFAKGKSKPKVRANSKVSNCRICEKSCSEPYMSPCGHLACSSCWVQWLKKSPSCPVCRKPASNDALARVVYETKPGSGVPSFSQLCNDPVADDGMNSDSDGEELEIV